MKKDRSRWFLKRKTEMFSFLGGKCVKCGKTENLEIDHIDPHEKEFSISKKWSYSWENIKKELEKCQLLCTPCHKEKHKANHGTLAMYTHHKCRCFECKTIWNIKTKQYKNNSKLKLSSPLV